MKLLGHISLVYVAHVSTSVLKHHCRWMKSSLWMCLLLVEGWWGQMILWGHIGIILPTLRTKFKFYWKLTTISTCLLLCLSICGKKSNLHPSHNSKEIIVDVVGSSTLDIEESFHIFKVILYLPWNLFNIISNFCNNLKSLQWYQ